jgi:hypothetical protein
VSRRVAKYKENCSACMKPIMPGTCIATLYNYSAHGRSECEELIVERYTTTQANAHPVKA